MTDQQRHARQLVLPGWGPRAQRAVEDARVLVVGAGGLGSPALLYLVAAGVGRGRGQVGIVDDDRVDITNLHRQILHTSADEGRPKVDSAADALRRLDPQARLHVHPGRLDAANAADIVAGYDLVLDGTDNFATRYLLNDTCARAGITYVWGALQAFAGQVGVAAPGHACYRCVFPSPPAPGAVPACGEVGVLGSVCASIAATQVTEALKILGGVGDPLVDRVLVHDALTMTWEQVHVAQRPGCVCSTEPAAERVPQAEPANEVVESSEVPGIAPLELAELLKARAVDVIDVRGAGERAVVTVPGSRAVPLADVLGGWVPTDGGPPVVVVCRSGVRSRAAAQALAERGVAARSLDGGVLAWVREITEWEVPG